jgi:hypothetical protein
MATSHVRLHVWLAEQRSVFVQFPWLKCLVFDWQWFSLTLHLVYIVFWQESILLLSKIYWPFSVLFRATQLVQFLQETQPRVLTVAVTVIVTSFERERFSPFRGSTESNCDTLHMRCASLSQVTGYSFCCQKPQPQFECRYGNFEIATIELCVIIFLIIKESCQACLFLFLSCIAWLLSIVTRYMGVCTHQCCYRK